MTLGNTDTLTRTKILGNAWQSHNMPSTGQAHYPLLLLRKCVYFYWTQTISDWWAKLIICITNTTQHPDYFAVGASRYLIYSYPDIMGFTQALFFFLLSFWRDSTLDVVSLTDGTIISSGRMLSLHFISITVMFVTLLFSFQVPVTQCFPLPVLPSIDPVSAKFS